MHFDYAGREWQALTRFYKDTRMTRSISGPNFADCLSVGQAAGFLGVSTATLRNWDRSGKLKPRRHPQNGYRIYLHEDLEAVLRSADLSTLTDESFAPVVDWNEMGESEHFVQFYENDEFLIESVSSFVGADLNDNQSGLVIATAEHRQAIQRKLIACGVDVPSATEAGRYVVLDASETMSTFMVGGMPDPQLFNETVGGILANLSQGGRRIRAFGEMVALLWAEGNRDAAIRLEELWNKLGKRYTFALFCAYPIANFDQEIHAAPFDGICSCHTRVIPTESYAANGDVDKRLRMIALLQQKAQSLEAEIEHRAEAQKALAKRERELADFFENATEGLHKVGADGTILWANKAEYDSLGYPAEEYIGHSITEFHVDAHVIADILQKLQTGQTLENLAARLRCKNGSIKQVLINSNACFENGEFAYTRCFTRDVTDQWQAEQALREADLRKDAFLATLAHELRNPLAPIGNALELLRVNQADEPAAMEAIEIMERQLRQLTRLVDDLLDISRITRDKIELRKETIELTSVIQNAIETSRPLIDSAGHELIVKLPTRPLFVRADAARMAQVFSNLLNNSAKYTQRGGQIEIDAQQIADEAVVTVRDNGMGISCEALAYVFDMFRQVDGSLERSQGGLGIGLTLVRRLVELHGGTINAQSEGSGKGCEFMVRIPLAAADAATTSASQAAGKLLPPKRRILVVDDNKDSGDTLSLLLRLKGHDVRTGRNGFEAVDLAAEFSPHVILMDVGMPKMNGYDATRRIREMAGGRDMLIIALTGWGQSEDVQRSADAGCSVHLVKPVDFTALEKLLAAT
jgi:PAS domain S-box-containing protein